MSSQKSELPYSGNTTVLDGDFTDESHSDEAEPEPSNARPPSRSNSDGTPRTYIRLDGFKESDLNEAAQDALLKTITTELLVNYDVPLEQAQIVSQDVQIIEVYDDMDD